MKIMNNYIFEFPTAGIVEKAIGYPIAGIPAKKGWTAPNVSFPKLGDPGAFDTVKKKPNCPTSVTGIDIPVLIKGEKSNGELIVLIAQDPLRKKSDYPSSVDWDNDIVVSLPFGVHVDNVNPVINGVVDRLLGEGYDVYITDCSKIYSARQKKTSDAQLIADELAALSGQYKKMTCVALGNRAQETMAKVQKLFPVRTINMLHPSGSANGAWKKKYDKCSDQDKIDIIFDAIKRNK